MQHSRAICHAHTAVTPATDTAPRLWPTALGLLAALLGTLALLSMGSVLDGTHQVPHSADLVAAYEDGREAGRAELAGTVADAYSLGVADGTQQLAQRLAVLPGSCLFAHTQPELAHHTR
jgi:hypothetical protein